MIGNVTRSSRDTVLGFPLMVWSRKRFQELLIAYYWQLHIEDPMLELRPTCEHSQQGAASRFAWCAHMFLRVHSSAIRASKAFWEMSVQIAVAGLSLRPVRPSRNWNGGNFLGKDPAST